MRTTALSAITGLVAVAINLSMFPQSDSSTRGAKPLPIELLAEGVRASEDGTLMCKVEVWGVRGHEEIEPTVTVTLVAPEPKTGMMGMVSRRVPLRNCAKPIVCECRGNDWTCRSDVTLKGVTAAEIARPGTIAITAPDRVYRRSSPSEVR